MVDGYIMKNGEKKRKNLALKNELVAIKTIPKTPNPINTPLG